MRRFAYDLRSLALYRMALAVILLVDLVERGRDLGAFYTDAGLVPKSDVVEWWRWSLHALSGSAVWQAALFGLAGVFALALLVGYRTRLATVGSWLLVVSLQNRNTMVLTGGDDMLRLMLFWSMFLPLGARYALDRARPAGARVASAGTFAYTVQIAAIYVFAAILKTGAEWRVDGTALAYALHIDFYVRPFGTAMLALPSEVLQAMTRGVWWLELLGPLLLLVPRLRNLAVLAFVALHAGIALCLSIGIFPFVGMIAWIPFVTWGRSEARLLREPRLLRWAVCFLAGFAVLWNLGTVSRIGVGPAAPLARAVRLDQQWALFAPHPYREGGWYVIEGRRPDGGTVDLYRYAMTGEAAPGAVTFDKPDDVAATFKTSRWNKYLTNLYFSNPRHLERFAAWLERSYRRDHGELAGITILRVVEKTVLEGPQTATPVVLHRHACGEPDRRFGLASIPARRDGARSR